MPQQTRSIERVERILDAAASLVVERGVERLSTRAVATAAGVPVATLYQYFADKDEILLALVERDVAEMDAQVAADLGALDVLSVRTVVETTMRALAAHRPLVVDGLPNAAMALATRLAPVALQARLARVVAST